MPNFFGSCGKSPTVHYEKRKMFLKIEFYRTIGYSIPEQPQILRLQIAVGIKQRYLKDI